jgi:hypothetical protein
VLEKFENKKNLYGLLNSQDNSFYIVSENYHVIKMIQMLLIKQKFLYCINISKLPGIEEIEKINNDNCHEFGVSAPMIKNIRFDSDPGTFGCKITKSKRPHNKVLAKNLVSLQKLLEPFEKFFDDFEKKEKQRYQDEISGLLELKDFMEILMPGDRIHADFIQYEISERELSIRRSRPLKSDILKIIMSTNYYDDNAMLDLRKKIENFETREQEYMSNTSDKIFLSDIVKKLILNHI